MIDLENKMSSAISHYEKELNSLRTSGLSTAEVPIMTLSIPAFRYSEAEVKSLIPPPT